MKVEYDKKGLKIILPKYKITTKKLKPTPNTTTYQYSCIVPPILCSFFNIQDNTQPEYTIGNNNLLFYNVAEDHYIMSSVLYELCTGLDTTGIDTTETINTDLINKIALNVNLNTLHQTTAYKLTNSNSYRVTLPTPIFKNMVNPEEDNYIRFIIDTAEEDILYNKGVVKYTVER